MDMNLLRSMIFAAACLASSALAQTSPALKGWDALAKAVAMEGPASADGLNGEQFTLEAAFAQEDKALQLFPEAAFKVDRVDQKRFLVTIVNAKELWEPITEDLLVPRKIGWKLVQSGEESAEASLVGIATCAYDVRFSQKGGGSVDIRNFDSKFAVNWEFDDSSLVETSERNGPGLTVRRNQRQGDLRLRLRVKKQASKLDLGSEWVRIPSCDLVAKKEPPSSKSSSEDVDVSGCVAASVAEIQTCSTGCGAFGVKLKVRYENSCKRALKCRDMPVVMRDGTSVVASKNTAVDFSFGSVLFADLGLTAAYKPEKFSVSAGTGICEFLP